MSEETKQSGFFYSFSKLEFISNFIIVTFLFSISVGVVLNYTIYTLRITPYTIKEIEYWKSVLLLTTIILIFNTILVFICAQINYNYRNFFQKNPTENPKVVYLICFPIIVFLIPSLIYAAIFLYLFVECGGYIDLIFAGSICLLFLSMIFLITNILNSNDTGELPLVNLINAETLLISFSSLCNLAIYNVILFFTKVFKSACINVINDTKLKKQCSVNTTKEFFWAKNLNVGLLIGIRNATIILGICMIPYFIKPLQSHFQFIYKKIEIRLNSFPNEYSAKKSYRKHFFGIILFILNFILLAVRKIFENLNYIQSFVNIFQIIYALYISILFLTNAKYTYRKKHDEIITRYLLISIGSIGKFVMIIEKMIYLIFTFYYPHDEQLISLIIDFIINGLLFIQTFFHSILLLIIIQYKFESRNQKIHNLLLILCLFNGIIFIYNLFIFEFRNITNYRFEIRIFELGLTYIDYPLTVLYRLFSCLLFGMKYLEAKFSQESTNNSFFIQ